MITFTVHGMPALPPHVSRSILKSEDGCWLWMRSKSRDGYGWASLQNKTYQAHRLVYRLLCGDPPSGAHLDHLCRVRHCVNPAHLEPVTPADNLRRSPLTPAGRVTCSKGHALSHTGRQRRCLVCLAEYQDATRADKAKYLREYRARRKAST